MPHVVADRDSRPDNHWPHVLVRVSPILTAELYFWGLEEMRRIRTPSMLLDLEHVKYT